MSTQDVELAELKHEFGTEHRLYLQCKHDLEIAKAAIKAAILAEREACAAACEGQTEGFAMPSIWDMAAMACARAIRARSNAEAHRPAGSGAAES